MADDSSKEQPIPGLEGTTPKENQIDREFKELNRTFFQEHSLMYSESSDPKNREADQNSLVVVQDMQRSMDQLSDPRKIDFVGRENMPAEVALGLGETYRVMASNRLPIELEREDPDFTKLREEKYRQSRELFLAAGKKLWPNDGGSERGLNFALQRLVGAKLTNFIQESTNNAKAIQERGSAINGRPPTIQEEQSIIDQKMSSMGEAIGRKVWEIADSTAMAFVIHDVGKTVPDGLSLRTL